MHILWGSAPKWANYLAQDFDGHWFWYQFRPLLRVGSKYWTENLRKGAIQLAQRHPRRTVVETFPYSLEERPNFKKGRHCERKKRS